jgi:uncharacterized membrane protein YeaQ/YmgE (transglycosylase-associated protein family)
MKAMLGIIWAIILGLIVGICARFIVPGVHDIGLLMTVLLGIIGSLVGDLVARPFSFRRPGESLRPAGFIWSVIAAVLLLWLWGLFVSPTAK